MNAFAVRSPGSETNAARVSRFVYREQTRDTQRVIHQGSVVKFVTHGRHVIDIARRFGWQAGARYTDLRKVRHVASLGFLDIDWQKYDFRRHVEAADATRPFLTVARDITSIRSFDSVLREAEILAKLATYVVIVPKAASLRAAIHEVPHEYLLGYSVPTRYGRTSIPISAFDRPVHLLGGRPDVQRRLAERMPVVSIDCNRFTLDACFGDYFDGEIFRPHPRGGYIRCLTDSISNITALWSDYVPRIYIA